MSNFSISNSQDKACLYRIPDNPSDYVEENIELSPFNSSTADFTSCWKLLKDFDAYTIPTESLCESYIKNKGEEYLFNHEEKLIIPDIVFEDIKFYISHHISEDNKQQDHLLPSFSYLYPDLICSLKNSSKALNKLIPNYFNITNSHNDMICSLIIVVLNFIVTQKRSLESFYYFVDLNKNDSRLFKVGFTIFDQGTLRVFFKEPFVGSYRYIESSNDGFNLKRGSFEIEKTHQSVSLSQQFLIEMENLSVGTE